MGFFIFTLGSVAALLGASLSALQHTHAECVNRCAKNHALCLKIEEDNPNVSQKCGAIQDECLATCPAPATEMPPQ